MSTLSTHVLNTSTGRPAEGVPITLSQPGEGGDWNDITSGTTNADGRITDFMAHADTVGPGTYRLRFDTAAYFKAAGELAFYPYVDVVFDITSEGEHYHVPLLISPFGYSTYRGS